MITEIRKNPEKTVIEEICVNAPMQINRSTLPNVDDVIGVHAELLGSQLHSISEALFPPTANKELRRFTSRRGCSTYRCFGLNVTQDDIGG